MLSNFAEHSILPRLANKGFGSIFSTNDGRKVQSYRLIAFDMDSTLIQTEVINEMAKTAGVGSQVTAITESAMRGEIDYQQSLKKRVSLLAGFDVSMMQIIAHSLPLTEGVEQLMEALKRLKIKTAIISGGFDFFGRHLQQKLGFDYVFGNSPEIQNGKLTGRVKGDIIDGPKKAELLKDIAAGEGINLNQTVAVGDGANDLQMMDAAGLSVAFNAKPLVRKAADRHIPGATLDTLLPLLGIQDRKKSDRVDVNLTGILNTPTINQVLRRYHV